MSLADRIKFAMDATSGLTQAGLARACGISRASVNGWTSGKTDSIDGKYLTTAAAYLNVSAHWLSTGEGEIHPRTDREFVRSAVESLKAMGLDARVFLNPGRARYHTMEKWLLNAFGDEQIYLPDAAFRSASGHGYIAFENVHSPRWATLAELESEHPEEFVLIQSTTDGFEHAVPKLKGLIAARRPDRFPNAAPVPIVSGPASDSGRDSDLIITQYDAGGAMGNGFELEEKQPGIIKSWRVDHDWLRLNVRHHTGLANLCIVTGFGPSMQPKYNPGDPLLMDRGVTTVETEGIYFFRVSNHGYIKQLQRIPTEDGLILRAKSLNKDYDPFDITKKMDFQVFGKILTVWKSEQL